jgi:Tfp pilus assembly protein PilO
MKKPWFIKTGFFILFGVIIGINIILKIAVLSPLSRGVSRLSAERETLLLKKDSLKEKEARLRLLEDRVRALEKEISYFENDVLSKKEKRFGDIIGEIDKVCAELSLERREVSYTHQALPWGIEEIDIIFPLSGEYTDIRRFIHRLENFPYFVVIDRLELVNPEEGRGRIILNISLSTYFTEEKEGVDGQTD